MSLYNAGTNPHRQTFYCLSTDTKPVNAYIGDRLYILDDGKHEIWNGTAWIEYFEPNVYVAPTTP
jgi:hypothetical protein